LQEEDAAEIAVFIKGKEHASLARRPQHCRRKILSDFRSSRQSKRAEIALMRAQTIAILITFATDPRGLRTFSCQFAHFSYESGLARPLQTTAAANKQRWPELSANN